MTSQSQRDLERPRPDPGDSAHAHLTGVLVLLASAIIFMAILFRANYADRPNVLYGAWVIGLILWMCGYTKIVYLLAPLFVVAILMTILSSKPSSAPHLLVPFFEAMGNDFKDPHRVPWQQLDPHSVFVLGICWSSTCAGFLALHCYGRLRRKR